MNSHKDTLRSQNKFDSGEMITYFYSVMIRRLLLLFLLVFPFVLKAQTGYVSCADSSRIDQYYKCYQDFQPQCGCDGKNYINSCAADFWGGLVTSRSYTPGICDNFFYLFAPNPVSAVSQPSSNFGSFLNIYVNDQLLPTSVNIYIFDVFNRIIYSRYLYVTTNGFSGNGTPDPNLTADFLGSLERGIYLLVVTVNGEKKAQKILKVNIQ